MSQVTNLTAKSVAVTALLFLITITSFSCSKSPSGVRAQVKKTSSLNLNQPVSAQAEAQAAAQNVLYKIASVSTPTIPEDGSPIQVSFELLTPSNQYLPVTTSHSSSNLDAQGVYQDTGRGVQIYVSARCTPDNCSKYYLLITVVRNGQALFQSGALSYRDDCSSFYSISVTNSFSSLDAFQTYVNAATQYAAPKNDCSANE